MLNIRLLSSLNKNIINKSIYNTNSFRYFSEKITEETPNQDELRQEYQAEIKDVMDKYANKKILAQTRVGRVISTKCAKTITVAIHSKRFIPKYNAYLRFTKKIMAHDEEEKCDEGDVVRIIPSQKKSKMKKYALYDILVKEGFVETPENFVPTQETFEFDDGSKGKKKRK
mmetsp:Transcript_11643/g.12019  ORF Transcript_11643/g.12019 Transcript_11643/m.12019 type:complete len:171 (+) Transcript_11643:21-533(+)